MADMHGYEGLFVIAKEPLRFFPSAHHVERLNGDWHLARDDFHGLCPVFANGDPVGWLLGTPVDLEAQAVLADRLDLECDSAREAVWNCLSERIAGSWLFISRTEDGIDLHPDACGTIGAVYDPETQAAASHAFLLLGDAYGERLDKAAMERCEVAGDGWMTGGLTAHRGVLRLLPNHRLSMPECKVSRLPLEFPDYDANVEPIIEGIAEEILCLVKALRQHGKVSCSLTGGQDVRAILAALRPVATEVPFFTFAYPHGNLDVELASRLARIAEIDHTVMPAREGGDPDKWLIGAGHAMAGHNKQFYPTTAPFAGEYIVGGLGGEIGRGFLWPENLRGDAPITAATVRQRLKFAASPQLDAVIDRWFERLPGDLDAYQILDLAYVELRMGCWAFAQPLMSPSPTRLHPLISHRQFRRMWSLPPEVRIGKGPTMLLIEQMWPELKQVPINSSGKPVRDLVRMAAKASKRPDLVYRKIRQFLPIAR